LHALPERTTVPWHRVVNAQGKISLRSESGADTTQKLRLQREGVRFSNRGVIDLKVYRWQA
jgi:methylated-DNA-protein-cysteine methyltransferase-like protein